MSVVENLFSRRGRLARKGYWLGVICTALFACLVLATSRPDGARWVRPIVLAVSFVFLIPLAARRFMDTNRSPLWEYLPLSVLAFITLAPIPCLDFFGPMFPSYFFPLFVIMIPGGSLLFLALTLVLGILPGTLGDNRYAAPPSERATLQTAVDIFE